MDSTRSTPRTRAKSTLAPSVGDRLSPGRHRVGESVDRDELIVVLESNVDSGSVARGPDAVRQPADRDGGHAGEVISAKHLDLVEAANRHIGERAIDVA